MKDTILAHYASKNTAFLHGGGKEGTELLFSKIDFSNAPKVLEIGFGTGASLVKLKSLFPKVQLFGIERNAFMYKKAAKRLKWTRSTAVDIRLVNENRYPFPDHFFDIIYIESVLGILPLNHIETILDEIIRILKPAGCLALNETIWLPEIMSEEIEKINSFCIDNYGIIQSNGELPNISAWCDFLKQKGFEVPIAQKTIIKNKKTASSRKEKLSRWFSLLGSIKGRLLPHLRKQEKTINEFHKELFDPSKEYMSSYIIIAQT